MPNAPRIIEFICLLTISSITFSQENKVILPSTKNKLFSKLPVALPTQVCSRLPGDEQPKAHKQPSSECIIDKLALDPKTAPRHPFISE